MASRQVIFRRTWTSGLRWLKSEAFAPRRCASVMTGSMGDDPSGSTRRCGGSDQTPGPLIVPI
jgi:hypothetical protein